MKKLVNYQEKILTALNKKSIDIYKTKIVNITEEYLDMLMNNHITKEANWSIKIFHLSGGNSDQRNIHKTNKKLLLINSVLGALFEST